MYVNKPGVALLLALAASAALAQNAPSASASAVNGAVAPALAAPALTTSGPSVTIGELARAQARAIEGEVADMISRLKADPKAAPAPAAPVAPATPVAPLAQGPGQLQQGGQPAAEQPARVARNAAPPKRTHIAYLGLFGESGNVTLEFELPNGQIVQRKSGDRIGSHRVEVAPSGRVVLVGKGMREVRPGDQFN